MINHRRLTQKIHTWTTWTLTVNHHIINCNMQTGAFTVRKNAFTKLVNPNRSLSCIVSLFLCFLPSMSSQGQQFSTLHYITEKCQFMASLIHNSIVSKSIKEHTRSQKKHHKICLSLSLNLKILPYNITAKWKQ